MRDSLNTSLIKFSLFTDESVRITLVIFFYFSVCPIIIISNIFVILSAQIYTKYSIILTVYCKIYVLKGRQFGSNTPLTA